MSTNDEQLSDQAISLVAEIEADAKREIARLETMISLATNSDDFDGIAQLIVMRHIEEMRLENAAAFRADALEFKSAVGAKH
jgi:hypothetical protein